MSHWSAPFVGIPVVDKGRSEAGVDCWGLVHLVYTRHLGIADFPSYADRYVSDVERAEIASIIAGEAELPTWSRMSDGTQPFDILFFRRGLWDSHAALVVDRLHVLHASIEAGQTVIERRDAVRMPFAFAGRYLGRRP